MDSQSTWGNTEFPPEAKLKQFCWEGADQKQACAEPGKHKWCHVFCAIMVPVGALLQTDTNCIMKTPSENQRVLKHQTERAEPPALEEEMVKEHLQDT